MACALGATLCVGASRNDTRLRRTGAARAPPAARSATRCSAVPPAAAPAEALRRRAALLSAAALLPAALLPAAARAEGPALESATFAAGDFVFLENVYANLTYAGVKAVDAGYVGADRVRAVRVSYDPARISYDRLLREDWKNAQPARSDGQFEGKGASFATALWVTTPAQRATAEQQRALLSQSGMFGGPVVTPVLDGPADAEFEAAPEEQRGFGKRDPKGLEQRRKKSGREAYLDPIWGLSTFCKDRVCGYVRFAKGCTAECLDVYTEYRDQPGYYAS